MPKKLVRWVEVTVRLPYHPGDPIECAQEDAFGKVLAGLELIDGMHAIVEVEAGKQIGSSQFTRESEDFVVNEVSQDANQD